MLPDDAAGEAAVHQRGQRDHADHEHAAQPRAPGRARRRRAPPLRAHARRRDLRRRSCASWRSKHDGFRLHEQHTKETGRIEPGRPRRAVPGLAGARGVHLRPGRAARRARRALGGATATATACTWSASSPSIGGGEEGEGGTITFSRATARPSPTAPSRSSWPARRPGLELPFGCREGICHTCVGDAALGRGPRPAHRQGRRRRRARSSAPASTRPRGPSRSNSEETHGQARRRPENPLHKLTPSRSRRSARSSTSSTSEVKDDLGERDAALHPRRSSSCTAGSRCSAASMLLGLALQARVDRSGRRRSRWPRSSRTWRSATTSCTASGTG